jgi:hypothetical protein
MVRQMERRKRRWSTPVRRSHEDRKVRSSLAIGNGAPSGKSAARAAVAVGGLVAMAFENRERDEVAARKGGLICKLKDPEIRGLMHIFGSRRIIVIQNRGLLA